MLCSIPLARIDPANLHAELMNENTLNKDVRHWRDISHDPNAPEVREYLRKTLLKAYQGRIQDTNRFLVDFVRDQSVLDIGIVAHTIEQSRDPRWRHNLIRNAASTTVGIDILEEPVMQLRDRGYDVRVVDATGEDDIGRRFSRVVIGDVIEHVDNPVALLRFAQRHLEPKGRILCSTPNPFHFGSIVSVLRHGVFIANAEHVSWITPTMALELGLRAELRLASYWHVPKSSGTLLRKLAMKPLALLGWNDSALASRTFVYMFERA
jgi:2-polyprenyl-3-methyl-5-hydroxy-6-metoxy-1,4-benzoquinol methylase